MDEVKHFFNDKPAKDFYIIFENKNGSKDYYKTSMEEYNLFLGRFGAMNGHWSYTCLDANSVYGNQ